MQEALHILLFSSYIKNENPLSTYHHLSKTLYSSHLQSGDRLKEELIKPVWKKL
ncbi:hypothetical protein M089_0532 [Bacteroides ovatus str. 3725 D9 iii]|jgi:hypothetical protein|nr:conserved domain protein [Bacteroides ovatus SD CMC 3f]KDS46701.1 hypothetical protein M089_0532 [Bacteroides ovatus str. 3725 D9 iii]KXT47084.1 hypothetical protein HMPREF2532_02504 [Bacteroides ovatus]CAG9876826.1 hypothetical protein BOVA115_873 [Bacteroides ovatus]CAG9906537.1 hypothetical protein BOVAB4_777 [Bacteroides ovatus]